ncbi:cupin-like domain-containing protein [Rhodoligotrophos defluvii]|uniref:cupin-like domain-containing protein n=1 Tax=Rhodoligotrophos defluvii TaxID=2561934 RepID=UPI0010C95179|nr:cupin-like domain-containing protein [Rhodoligotrophos defluvii]
MGHYLSLTADQAQNQLLKRPFKLHHQLVDHPLFQLDRLVRLAQKFDRDRIEYNAGSVGIDQRPDETPRINMAPEAVIRSIEQCNAWLVIKNVELDPEYKALLEGAVADIRAAAGLAAEDMTDVRGFLFVSSANSITPFHIDGEDNILVHIHGRKFVHIFDNEDRTLVGEAAMEMSPDKHRNQTYRPEFEARAEVFELAPGEAVHIPYLWPHWVSTGNSYAISLAVTWKSKRVVRANKIRFMNGALRRIGLPQRPPGERPLLDAAKVAAFDVAHAVIEPLRQSERTRRLLRQALFGRRANYFYEK